MPRALSSQQTKVLTKRRYTTACRVRVKDSTGTFQDLRAFLGRNWVARIDYGGDIDDQCASASIQLFRDRYAISLAPLVETSKANLLTGSYAPLIDAMREIIIEAALLPEGVSVVSGDWIEVFRGFIDKPSWGGKFSSLSLDCRDLAAPLAEIVTETEGRPDTSAYGLDPSGRPLEEVCQDVLDDWATLAGYTIVLYTPTGTLVDPRPVAERCGFNVKRFVPAKGQSLLDTLRILANFVGYDVKVRWSSVTNTFRLELYNPPRGNTTPDVTIGPGAIRDVQRLEIDPSSVRNAVVVTYLTNPDDENTSTSTTTATDSTSITRYRRRWMEVVSGAASGINSATEANQMRDAIISDLKDPKAEMIVESSYRPDVVLNDLVRWSPDAKHFTADQDLACVSLRHRIEPDGKAETIIATRGRPCGQFTKWLYVAAGPNTAGGKRTWPGVVFAPTVTADIGSVVISIDASNLVDRDILHWEYHLSTAGAGFTPDASTRVARGNMTRVQVAGLTAGTTYYAKVVTIRPDGVRSVSSAASSAIPTKLGNALLDKLDYLELKDMDGTPVADRRLRVVDGEIRSADTSNVEGQYIRGSSLKDGTGPLTKLSSGGFLDSLTSITTRVIDNLTDGTYARTLAAALSAGKINLAAGSAGLAGQLPEAQLGDLAVTTAKVAAGAVTTAKIGALAVTVNELAANAVTNAKVDAAAAISGSKMSSAFALPGSLSVATTMAVTGAATFQAPAKFEQKLSVLAAASDGTPVALVFDRAGRNAVKNPSFEINTSDWTPANGTVTRTNAKFLWGGWCGILDGTSAVNRVEITSNSNAALDAETWTASAYIRGVTGTVECSLKIEFLSAGDVVLDTTTSGSAIPVDAVTSEWRRIVLNATASDVLTAKVRMSVIGGLSTDTDVYVDACQLEKTSSLASHASSYMDGSLGEGYAWEGTAHASASTRTGGWSHLGGLDGTLAKYLMVTDEGTLMARSLAAGSDVVWVETGNKATGFIEGEVRAKGVAADVHLNLVPQGSNGRVRLGPSGTALSIAGAGTSFPTSPSTNDVFFRTDLGILFCYNGTNWISVSPCATVAFHALRTTNQTPGTSIVKVLWNSEEYDYGADFDADGVDSNFTAPIAGLYSFSAGINVNLADTQSVDLQLFKNGALYKRLGLVTCAVTSQNVTCAGSLEMELAVGNVIDVRAATSAASKVINGGGIYNWFCGRLVRAIA